MKSNRLPSQILALIAVIIGGCTSLSVRDNGLAKTPPMGWNSWNAFGDTIDDHTVRMMADAMVSSGMRDAGYVFVNIDDTWQGGRDAQGNLHGNARFPDMKALAAYVHSKGLKLGLYSSPGPITCAGYTGSYGHEFQDAATFADWGVDYLKYDWCSADEVYSSNDLPDVYAEMGQALRVTGRPIVYSLCEYGAANVARWGRVVGGNLWRTTTDVRASWDSVISNIEQQSSSASFAGPGHWNDPDTLEIGNGSLSEDEYRSQMSLWALSAAPLITSNDLRNMPAEVQSILVNSEVIAIDQDPLGKQAEPREFGQLEIWTKPLADRSEAVGILNRSPEAMPVALSQSQLGLDGTVLSARDVWAHAPVSFANGQYSSTVPPHGTVLLRISFE